MPPWIPPALVTGPDLPSLAVLGLLAGVVVLAMGAFRDVDDPEKIMPLVLDRFMTTGLRGLVIAGLALVKVTGWSVLDPIVALIAAAAFAVYLHLTLNAGMLSGGLYGVLIFLTGLVKRASDGAPQEEPDPRSKAGLVNALAVIASTIFFALGLDPLGFHLVAFPVLLRPEVVASGECREPTSADRRRGLGLSCCASTTTSPSRRKSDTRSLALQDVEREHILATLEQTGWRVRGPGGAAELLGLKPSTLESRLSKLGVRRPAKSPR